LPANDTGTEFAHEADRIAEVLREAGEIALKTFRGEIRSWTKGHNSPVSDADIAVDLFLREKLSRPGIGWLSEESVDDLKRLDSERIFIVDPIDGTRSYLAGREDWSICAALVERGRPVAAAIYAPALREMYVASAACGASLNGARIETSTGASLDGARVAGPQQCLDRVAKLAPAAVAMPKIHSLALRFARVASGQIDVAFASVNARDWDLAAADLLVHEAGGAMTGVSGEPLVYNLQLSAHGALIAAGRERHAALIGLMRERRKKLP
jgi:myo-inositol-1(or 4)-monophosphatase